MPVEADAVLVTEAVDACALDPSVAVVVAPSVGRSDKEAIMQVADSWFEKTTESKKMKERTSE